MPENDPWVRLKAAILEHDQAMQASSLKKGSLPQLPALVRKVAAAADDVTAATSKGEKTPKEHPFLFLHAMRIVGMTLVSRWVAWHHLQGHDRPFSRILDALPDVPTP